MTDKKRKARKKADTKFARFIWHSLVQAMAEQDASGAADMGSVQLTGYMTRCLDGFPKPGHKMPASGTR